MGLSIRGEATVSVLSLWAVTYNSSAKGQM